MNRHNSNVLIAGASGYVGSRLAPRLRDAGYNVRCVARNPHKLINRQWNDIDIVKGNMDDIQSLREAMKGMEIAFYLVHAMSSHDDFAEKDNRYAHNFSEVAKECGVKRIIYLGGLGNADQNLSPHLKSRQKVGQVLGSTGIPVTELRASIIIGSGSASFEIIRDLVKKLPVMITPRWVKSMCQPIAIRTVLEYLIGVIEITETRGRIFDIGGNEILSYADMMRQVAAVMNKKLFIMNIPVLTPKLSAYWLNLVTTVPMSIAYPLVEGLKNDTICQNQEIDQYVKVNKRPFRDAVKDALIREQEHQVESRWTEADIIEASVGHAQNSGQIDDLRKIRTSVPAKHIFQTVQKIGGENGWFYGNWAWNLRGGFDRLIGGVGMRRGRRHPFDIRIGDAIDFWRVTEFESGQRLKLEAEMKLPGTAWLEFKVEQLDENTTIFYQNAVFRPQNWFGYLYWYLLSPAHYFIFRNMALNIVHLAAQKSSAKVKSVSNK
jgi:uncharacterized protein YbjT (DUF2867 family)